MRRPSRALNKAQRPPESHLAWAVPSELSIQTRDLSHSALIVDEVQLAQLSTILESTEAIVQVLQHTSLSPSTTYEPEYHYGRIGSIKALQIPRLRRSYALNAHLATHLRPTTTTTGLFVSAAHPDLTLTITSPGLLDTLTFIANPAPPIPSFRTKSSFNPPTLASTLSISSQPWAVSPNLCLRRRSRRHGSDRWIRFGLESRRSSRCAY